MIQCFLVMIVVYGIQCSLQEKLVVDVGDFYWILEGYKDIFFGVIFCSEFEQVFVFKFNVIVSYFIIFMFGQGG